MRRLLVLVAFATIFTQITAEKFSCEGRASGYYADVDTGCQIYHMCDGLGRQFSYSCPNTTLFQQRMLICDHWYMVNCSKSELDYKANLLIGQKDKPFVEDSSEHPYHRTPRPDLLEQPYAPSYEDDTYRQSRAQNPSSLNLVGVATDDDAEDELGNRKNFSTDRPQYFLPSHWSTQYGKGLTTPLPSKINNNKPLKPLNSFNNKSPVTQEKKFSTLDLKNPDIPPRKQQSQDFNNPKYFKVPLKITNNPVLPTPVSNFPTNNNDINKFNSINPRVDNVHIPDSINQETVSPSTLALAPFVPIQPQVIPTPFQNAPKVPQIVPPQLDNPKRQLTPQVTQQTRGTSQQPSQIVPQVPNTSFRTVSQVGNTNTNKAINPPVINSKLPEIPKPSIYYQPPKFSSFYDVESTTMDPRTFYKLVPSKELLPPVIPPQFQNRSSLSKEEKSSTSNFKTTQSTSGSSTPSTITSRATQTEKSQNTKTTNRENESVTLKEQSEITEKRWKELRQMFFIPEYDFPLEIGNRPSYEGGLSSFQVNPAPPNPETYRRPDTKSSDSSLTGRNPVMRFPDSPRGINPECPKCDPAFLAPGTCKPCVMIRR